MWKVGHSITPNVLPKLLNMFSELKIIALFTWMLPSVKIHGYIRSTFQDPYFPPGFDEKCAVLTRKENNGLPPGMFGVGPA